MIDYILANKEWIFSGVGVLIVGSLCGVAYRLLIKRASPPQHGHVTIVQVANHNHVPAPSQVPAQSPSPITRITPITMQEIKDAISEAPPLQRADIIKHYEGITIQWETRLFNATANDKNNVRLALDFPTGISLVYCDVRLSDYSELGVLPRGAPISVIGRIKQVDATFVTLEDAQLLFHARSKG